MNYNIVNDAQTIDEQFGSLSPFNLKKDIKGFSAEQLNNIAEDVANELKNGPHGDTYNIIYKSKVNIKLNFSKIRCEDYELNKGKSNGYRCIVLVDNESHFGFILHIYKHGPVQDKYISKNIGKLKILVDTYAKEKKEYFK